MAHPVGIDHRILAGSLIAVSAGIAAYSSYKLWSLKRSRRHHGNSEVYETQKSLHEYLIFHYGLKNELLQYDFGPQDVLDFPKRCADMCMQYFQQKVRILFCFYDVVVSILTYFF